MVKNLLCFLHFATFARGAVCMGNRAETHGNPRKPAETLAETPAETRGNPAETPRKPCGNHTETSRRPRGNLVERIWNTFWENYC